MPSSIHVLVSRQSFLHVGLKEAVLRLYKFAPVSFSSIIKREEPGDDNTASTTTTIESNAAKHHRKSSSSSGSTLHHQQQQEDQQEYPVCWFEDEDTQFALRWHLFVGVLWDMKQAPKTMPWKIRLHFTQYPSSQILPIDTVLETVEHAYMNSLKQALFLQYSSNKVAMSMSKQTHEQIWDSIVTGNVYLYHQVNADLQQQVKEMKLLPIRVLVNTSKPPIQRPCRVQDSETLTLGCVLAEWCPLLFHVNDKAEVEPIQADTFWTVQGIQVELSTNLVDLWRSLCCPDHFLYVVVSTSSNS